MTSNQLILLLEVYRTGDLRRVAVGTTAKDLSYLRGRGLIETDSGEQLLADRNWFMTTRGNNLVRALLTVLS